MIRKAVTVLAHRRPDLLARTLDALEHCHDRGAWDVIVVADRPDPYTRAVLAGGPWPTVELDLRNEADPPYSRISLATKYALALGFAQAEFVAHLEEDCEPGPDFLEYMGAMAARYRDTAAISVSAWWPAPATWGDAPPRRAWYTVAMEPVPEDGIATWGIGTWADRWEEIRDGWNPHHWDRNLAGGRVVHPLVSRVRNIGRLGTQPVDEHDWRNREQTPAYLPDAPPGGWSLRA